MATPTPLGKPVHEGMFATRPDGSVVLLGGYSPTSRRHHFPRQSTCPFSGAADVQPIELSRTGTLWGWTAVTAPPPGYHGEVPFGFGVVELPEGIRVITRLTEPDPSRLTFGMGMTLVAAALHTDEEGVVVETYAFAPAPLDPPELDPPDLDPAVST